ncbi:MAG TPA: hypothetical protein VNL14_01815 [Candidatus Acidoferrales bacterium]|nr:hypothetical protein [Candidatus Acidoferrales bacterium]
MFSNTKDALCFYGAPLALILVALVQIYKVETLGLTPWKGGGFGMFAFIDSRFLRLWIVVPQKELPLEVPSHIDWQIEKAKNVPTIGNMRRLAAAVWETRHAIRSNANNMEFAGFLLKSQLAFTIRVELWEMELESDTGRLRPKRIAVHSFVPGVHF